MVTGSADYSLRLWKGGQCKQEMTGIHTQAVRGMIAMIYVKSVIFIPVDI